MKIISRCPLCDNQSDKIDTHILGDNGESRLLHLRCQKCSNSILALVLVSPGGVSSLGLLTDLTFEDVRRFKAGNSVTIDDVIRIHEVLENSGLTFSQD